MKAWVTRTLYTLLVSGAVGWFCLAERKAGRSRAVYGADVKGWEEGGVVDKATDASFCPAG